MYILFTPASTLWLLGVFIEINSFIQDAAKALSMTKLTELEKMSFRMQCIYFLRAAVEKIIAKSPLKYSVVCAISCFVPSG